MLRFKMHYGTYPSFLHKNCQLYNGNKFIIGFEQFHLSMKILFYIESIIPQMI